MSRQFRDERWRFAFHLCVACSMVACSTGDSRVAVGTLERDRIELVAEVSEPVIERPVEEGAFVEAGALLVKLDSTRVDAHVAQAEAARARAEARLSELVRGPRQERIAEVRAQLKGTEGRLSTARNSLARMQSMVDGGVASTEQLEQSRAAFDEALAARDATRATLEALLDGTTEEELAQAEAALAEADAMLRDARVQRDRLEVRAPVAGWVETLPFERGERPPAGGVVAVLLSSAAPYARVYIPAAIRLRVTSGTTAHIRIDGVDEPVEGRVRVVASDASFTPYFALTERDRGRLVYVSKVDLLGPRARELPSGIPVEVEFALDAPAAETTDVRARN